RVGFVTLRQTFVRRCHVGNPRIHRSSPDVFAKTMDCRVKPGNDESLFRLVRRDCQPQSSRAPRAPLLSPKSLVLPREPAGGDAHDLLRVGDGGADHLRRAAVSFEDCKRALGAARLDHVAEADAHVEDLEHLAVVDLGVALDEGKDGMRLDEPVDLVADGGGDEIMMATPAKESHDPHPQPLPTRGEGSTPSGGRDCTKCGDGSAPSPWRARRAHEARSPTPSSSWPDTRPCGRPAPGR